MWSDLNFTTLGCQHLTDHLVIKRMINYTDFLAENAPVNFKRGDDFNQVSDLIIYDILFTITVFGSFISSVASCIWRSFFFLRISPFFSCLRIPPIQSTGSIIFCTKIRITTLATYRMKIITLRSALFLSNLN